MVRAGAGDSCLECATAPGVVDFGNGNVYVHVTRAGGYRVWMFGHSCGGPALYGNYHGVFLAPGAQYARPFGSLHTVALPGPCDTLTR
jgi:hypothetical protein